MQESASVNFRLSRAADNVRRVRIVTLGFIGINLLFGVINITALLLGTLQSTSKPLAFFYVAFFLHNVLTYFVLRSGFDSDSNDLRRAVVYERIVFFYVFVVMVIGAFISLFDQQEYQHLMVHTMIMLICSSFVVLPWAQILVPIVFSSIILAVGLPYFVEDQHRLAGFYQHLVSYAPVTFAISRVVYRMFSENLQNNIMLEQEIEKNRMLNEELKRMNKRLKSLAWLDELTGIANLRGLEAYLKEQLDENKPILFGAIVMDVDYFKEYNDHHGHGEGDEVLAQVANILGQVASKTSGFVSRWGGEEFIYVAPDKNRDEILAVCEEIHRRISDLQLPHAYSEVSSYVTLSQGACSTVVQTIEDVRACIQQADVAMYTTKKRGRNGYTYLPYPESSERSFPRFLDA